jgi:magnesium chelatase family protein
VLAKVWTCAVIGLQGELVQVEVDITASNLSVMNVVGLPDTAVQEARERVRAAIRNSGFYFPPRRVTVNLAPAEVRKSGASYDLPIAIAVLLGTEQVHANVADTVFLGELSLDGEVRHLSGVLPMVGLARDRGIRTVYVPAVDAEEAALVEGMEVIPVQTLAQLVAHLRGELELSAHAPSADGEATRDPEPDVDLANIRGQEHAKRALEVAAAGSHNILFSGPPGTGKTLLARALAGILPRMSSDESLEVTRIYSVAGQLNNTALIRRRPFRSPHHTISQAGLVGGGVGVARPGELSLAHRGVLFLDEMPEFNQQALEVMRQPLEDGMVSIGRSKGTVSFPSRFMLVGSMNPCPCGYLGDPMRACTCSSGSITRYQKRLSGPLLDRIDIHVEVPRIEYEKLAGDELAEASGCVRERVEAARNRQWTRYRGGKISSNAEMGVRELRRHCALDEAGEMMMRAAVNHMALSARAYHRVLKVARTIADLAEAERIAPAHVAEAIQYQRRAPA